MMQGLALSVSIASGVVVLAGCTARTNDDDAHGTATATGNTCITCHGAAYLAATNPKHENVLSKTCEDCHSQTIWSPIVRLHDLPAVSAKDCVTCHQTTYDATSKPTHAPVFPTKCNDCHLTTDWQSLSRDIHTSDTFKQTKCFDCHVTQYNAAMNPKHDGVFPTACEQCHNTQAWKPGKTQ